MAVDIALVAGIRRHAHRIQQLLAAEHPLGLFEQALQQAEFMARQAQGLAAIADLHAFRVDLEQRRSGSIAGRGDHALEDRPDPRRHFPWAERLDHIIVGADFQPHHPIDLGIARAEEHHRHFAETAQLLAGFETADVGQADVEDDQVGRASAADAPAPPAPRLSQVVVKPSPCRANISVSAIAASSSTIRIWGMASEPVG